MPGSKSDWFSIQVLNLLRGVGISAFSGYIGLFTSACNDSGPGTEVSVGSYARVAVSFDFIDTTTIANNGVLTFPTPTADWGLIDSWALFDASSGGNYILFGPQSPPRHILTGDDVRYDTHTLTWSED